VSIIYSNDEIFELGKSKYKHYIGKTVKSSAEDKLVVVTYGVIVHESLKAYESLKA